jgi:hypothetical protein
MKRFLLKPIFIVSILIIGITSYVIIDIMNTTVPLSKEELPNTEKKARKATIKYFKKEKNLDIIITKFSFSGELGVYEVYLEGHVTNNEQIKISATVDVIDDNNYKVTDTTSNQKKS